MAEVLSFRGGCAAASRKSVDFFQHRIYDLSEVTETLMRSLSASQPVVSVTARVLVRAFLFIISDKETCDMDSGYLQSGKKPNAMLSNAIGSISNHLQ